MTAKRQTGERQRFIKKFALSSVVGFAIVLFLNAEQFLNVGIVERLELASLDLRFQLRGQRLTSNDSAHVIIVERGNESDHSLPARYPWPRSYYAHLVRNLSKAGARAVGLDIIFVGQDSQSPGGDDDLRSAIRETGIVVLAGRLEIDNRSYRVLRAEENYGNEFFNVDHCLGFANVNKDPDEVIRRYIPSASGIPSFGFAVLSKLFGLPSDNTPTREGNYFVISDRAIPRYDDFSVLVNYYGPNGSFRHIDFADVLDDKTFITNEEAQSNTSINTFDDPDFGYLYDGTFRDKIVLVGSTLPEEQDVHQVAIGRREYTGDNTMYGVEIHANLIESVIRGDFLQRQSKLSEILTTFALAIIVFFATSALKSSKTRHHTLVEINGLLVTVASLAIVVFISLRLFIDASYVVATVSPMLAIIGGYFSSTAYHFVAERRARVMIKSMFSTYVNPSLVDQLVTNPEKLKLGGERKELTVLFSDLEGFTALAETRPPEELVGLLNEYLSSMTNVVLRNNGTLDKFEGDLIMAFWGAPIPQDDHAKKACAAALQMQSTLAKMRLDWGLRKRPLLTARIGISTGDAVVGNMGSAEKFNYTVIGDSVNLGARLEGTNKIFRTEIIISDQCYRQVRDLFLCRELDIVAVRGRTEPVRIFELRSTFDRLPDGQEERFVSVFEAGLSAYRKQEWKEAATRFDEALSIRQTDHPSELYLGRISRLSKDPPGPDWNGIYLKGG